MITFITGFVCLLIGLTVGELIGGHVAYEEGVMDERYRIYMHAKEHHWKVMDFLSYHTKKKVNNASKGGD